MEGDDERLARAAGRKSWPVRRLALGEESDDLSRETTAIERIAMMWPLALEAWRMAGLPIPDYAREDTPCRLVRGPRETPIEDLADVERLEGKDR